MTITECNQTSFGFKGFGAREVVARFDGGTISSYCGRGDMENRIKEQFCLFADRVSAETMRANQMRLYLSSMAYVLVSGLRRLGLQATELAQAQVATIRTRLFKIGAQIRVTTRKVWISMASSYPWQNLYQQVWANLRC